jgi:predicted DNA-binding transcriptional regulator YafY
VYCSRECSSICFNGTLETGENRSSLNVFSHRSRKVVYRPTARVLTVLELLQAHGRLTGAELARRLELDMRTVRNYIQRLADLGVPISAERGRYGAYFLRPGYKLPPLIFTEDESLALTLSLLVAHAHASLTPKHRLRLARLIVEDGWPPARKEAFFELATERLLDRGSRAYLEAGNPPRNGATRNFE